MLSLHFYLDYRHVVWCSFLHFDYMYLTTKFVHWILFGLAIGDGYWYSTTITMKCKRKKAKNNNSNTKYVWFGFCVRTTAANQYQNYINPILSWLNICFVFIFQLEKYIEWTWTQICCQWDAHHQPTIESVRKNQKKFFFGWIYTKNHKMIL